MVNIAENANKMDTGIVFKQAFNHVKIYLFSIYDLVTLSSSIK